MPDESIHQKLKRLGRPHPYLTDEFEQGRELKKWELPFVIGVLGDFSGAPFEPPVPLSERRFLDVHQDSLDAIVAQIGPELKFRVENTLQNDGSEIAIWLKFQALQDFAPLQVAEQIPVLKSLLTTRAELQELMSSQGASLPPVVDSRSQDSPPTPPLAPPPVTASSTSDSSSSLLDTIMEGMTPVTPIPRKAAPSANVLQDLLGGTRDWNAQSQQTVHEALLQIDRVISRQLAAVMHHPRFQKLEGTWRGLQTLVSRSEICETLKIKVLDVQQQELLQDAQAAEYYDMTDLFEKVYSEALESDGEPFTALIGDYEFSNHPDDVTLLEHLSEVCAAAFSPFIAAAAPALLGHDDFTGLGKPHDIARVFQTPDYAKWRSFRDSVHARFVVLTLPRVLARTPYQPDSAGHDAYCFDEIARDSEGRSVPMPLNHFTWMNAAFVYGVNLTAAFARTNWCVDIQGAAAGRIEGLPTGVFINCDGKLDPDCPTEIGITDRRNEELSQLGFLPLCHLHRGLTAFMASQSTQRPKQYVDAAANLNALLAARVPQVIATSRIAQYLKVITQWKHGAFSSRDDLEGYLQAWLSRYVSSGEPSAETKAVRPLADGQISISPAPGYPGRYVIIASLKLWGMSDEGRGASRVVVLI